MRKRLRKKKLEKIFGKLPPRESGSWWDAVGDTRTEHQKAIDALGPVEPSLELWGLAALKDNIFNQSPILIG